MAHDEDAQTPRLGGPGPPSRLAGAIDAGLGMLPRNRARRISRRLRRAAADARMWMGSGDDRFEVTIAARPMLIDPATAGYVHHAAWQLRSALQRLGDLAVDRNDLTLLGALRDDERDFFLRYHTPDTTPLTRFCRLDALLRAGPPGRPEVLAFVEPNVAGVGGICYATDTADAVLEYALPEVLDPVDLLYLQAGVDPRQLLLDELLDFARLRHDVVSPTIGLLDDRAAFEDDGEKARLLEWMTRHGAAVRFVEPDALGVASDGGLVAGDTRIDVVYRLLEVVELLDLEARGADLTGVRAAFEQDRILPTIGGELEAKSVFEVFTSRPFWPRFTPAQRDVFMRHVLWTRVLVDRRTDAPDGGAVDLPAFVRREREHLVIKPARSYGGEGVLIGPSCDVGAWDDAIEAAVAHPGRAVVQQLAPPIRQAVPVLGPRGAVVPAQHEVIGVFPGRAGMGVLGRRSSSPVVNISTGASAVGVLIDLS